MSSRLLALPFACVLSLTLPTLGCAAETGTSESSQVVATTSPKLKWGASLLRRPADWYATDEAKAASKAVMRYQSEHGAWPKNTDLLAPATAEEIAATNRGGKGNTIDNGATTLPIRFLAKVAQATGSEACKDAVLRGVDYLLSSQYENGGFPQFFPLRKGYYSHITYNDGAMINALEVLRDVAEAREPFSYVDEARRTKAAYAVTRGIHCIVHTQVIIDDVLMVWCAQYDEVSLAPAGARKYEPPSFSGAESVGIVRFLMSIEKPSPEVIDAIEAAVAWFPKVAIKGQRLQTITREDGLPDRVLVADPAAEPLWARFYELSSMRPIYIDRDTQFEYEYDRIDRERRVGYAYLGTWPADLLAKDYPKWRKRLGRP